MKAAMLVLAALLGAEPALAQQTPQPPPPASAGKGTDTPGGSATNGVIMPPSTTDPDIAKPAPQTGRMPIIPPKATNTVPK